MLSFDTPSGLLTCSLHLTATMLGDVMVYLVSPSPPTSSPEHETATFLFGCGRSDGEDAEYLKRFSNILNRLDKGVLQSSAEASVGSASTNIGQTQCSKPYAQSSRTSGKRCTTRSIHLAVTAKLCTRLRGPSTSSMMCCSMPIGVGSEGPRSAFFDSAPQL